ncbi:hypothetical protein [Marinomonas balearica]|nr:hypothetical protein [Marinomonas balearica]
MSGLAQNLSDWLESEDEELDISIDQFQCSLNKMALNVHCCLHININENDFNVKNTLDIASFTFEKHQISPAINKFGQYALSCSVNLTSDLEMNSVNLNNSLEHMSNFADAWLQLSDKGHAVPPTTSDSRDFYARQSLSSRFQYTPPTNHA